MKRMTRVLAAVLALVLLLSTAATAAPLPVENSLGKITNPATGATVTFASEADKEGKIAVTYTAKGLSGYYLVVMVEPTVDTDGNKSYIPTEKTIKYIDQSLEAISVGADEEATLTFTVYPKDIVDSAILIYGAGMGNDGLVAALIEGSLLLGDVDGNGKIGLPDVVLILKDIANIEKLEGTQARLADVDKKGTIGLPDVVLVLKLIAGLISYDDL